MKRMIRKFTLLLATVVVTTAVMAQDDKPVASPAQTVKGTIKGANITINYGSPAVKGRKIWGGLEPFDKVWRAGANDATTFETDKDLKIGTGMLPAGKYTFFLIPAESGQWTAIFNKVQKQWGAYTYKESEDQLRVKVTPQPLKATQERLVYKINKNNFALEWDKLSVAVPVN
ncbi:MAG: DUF2911 domain-containing protein [Pedobacter sp.]|nr:MAG: DUF2911 domain-containing protein [Pedobacter sp.]